MNHLFDFQWPSEFTQWTSFLYLIQALVILSLGSFAYAKLRRVKIAEQLAEKDNPAFAISYAGFLAALGIVIAGVIQSPSVSADGWSAEFIDSLIWAVGSVVLLLGALLINDFILFPKFQNRKEILDDRNTGLAVVEASSFIATALLINASLSEQITPVDLGEPWLTLIYFVIGQAMFLLYSRVYPKVAGLDLHRELENDNPAVGLAFGGSLLAFSWLLATALTRYDSLSTIIVWALVSLVILSALRFIVRVIFSKKISLSAELQRDRNWGMGIVEAVTSLIVAAILIASFS